MRLVRRVWKRAVRNPLLAASMALLGALSGGLALPSAASAESHCGDYAIKAANGKYVSAEMSLGGNDRGMLRARADSVGPWETFYICWRNDPGPGNTYALIYSEGGLVSAELGYGVNDPRYGMLRGRADGMGPWEKFQIDLNSPNRSTIRSLGNPNNLCYTSAELGYNGNLAGMLRTRSSCYMGPPSNGVGPWERYTFQQL
jgi:hypothetical protein